MPASNAATRVVTRDELGRLLTEQPTVHRLIVSRHALGVIADETLDIHQSNTRVARQNGHPLQYALERALKQGMPDEVYLESDDDDTDALVDNVNDLGIPTWRLT